jgi:hypothetical protein
VLFCLLNEHVLKFCLKPWTRHSWSNAAIVVEASPELEVRQLYGDRQSNDWVTLGLVHGRHTMQPRGLTAALTDAADGDFVLT